VTEDRIDVKCSECLNSGFGPRLMVIRTNRANGSEFLGSKQPENGKIHGSQVTPAVLVTLRGLAHGSEVRMHPQCISASSVQRTCEQCGISFTTHRSRVKHGRGRFCSRTCGALAKAVAAKSRFVERFWAKVDRTGDGCWPWLGLRTLHGYGQLGIGSATDGTRTTGHAHRVAYELAVGPIPPGMAILHRCDNPPCVRPDHLLVGSQRANIDDMVSKNRSTHGEHHPQVKLTAGQVVEIRNRYALGGILQRELAAEFRTTQGNISAIIRGALWRDR
jgi:hypothetical protein